MTSLAELATELRDLKDQKEALEEQLTAIKARVREIEIYELPPTMEDKEIDKFTVPDVGTISVKTKVYSSIKKDDRSRFYQWLRESGNGDVIVDWVFPGTQNAFIKERIETGQEYPEFCNVSLIPTASLRRT